MKANFLFWIILIALSSMMFQGYQCGSTEMTSAKLYIQQKNYDAAIKNLEGEVQKNPGNEEAWYLLGGLKADKMDYMGMNYAFQQALKLSDKHSVEIRSIRYNKWGIHLNNGVSYLERASSDSTILFDKSLEEFQKASLAWPDTALTYRYLGYAYNNMASSDSSSSSLKVGMTESKIRSLLGSPTRIQENVYENQRADFWFYENQDATLYFVKGELRGWSKQIKISPYDNALKAFKTAWEKGKDVESLKRAGRIYLQWAYDHKSKFEADNAGKLKTLKDLNEVKKGSSKNDVMRTLGAPDDVKRGARGTKKEEWTYKNYNVKLSIDGDKVTEKRFTSPYKSTVDSTETRLAMKEFDNAIHTLEQVKDADPADNENLNFLLRAYVESGRIKEAIKTYQQAAKNDPNNKQIHYILGVLYRTEGDFIKAISEFETAQKIDANFVDAIFDLGATYYNWGVDIIKAANDKGEDTQEFKEKFKKALPYMEKLTTSTWDNLKIGMSLDEVKMIVGQPESVGEAMYENVKSQTLRYENSNAIVFMVERKLKGWNRIDNSKPLAGTKKDDPSVWETLGTMYARLGQSDKAKNAFEKADKIRKGN